MHLTSRAIIIEPKQEQGKPITKYLIKNFTEAPTNNLPVFEEDYDDISDSRKVLRIAVSEVIEFEK